MKADVSNLTLIANDTCTPDGGYYSIVGTDGNR